MAQEMHSSIMTVRLLLTACCALPLGGCATFVAHQSYREVADPSLEVWPAGKRHDHPALTDLPVVERTADGRRLVAGGFPLADGSGTWIAIEQDEDDAAEVVVTAIAPPPSAGNPPCGTIVLQNMVRRPDDAIDPLARPEVLGVLRCSRDKFAPDRWQWLERDRTARAVDLDLDWRERSPAAAALWGAAHVPAIAIDVVLSPLYLVLLGVAVISD